MFFWNSLSKPIIGLSPMDGITDFPMREIQAEIAKPDVIYTEFVSIEGFLRKPAVFLPKLKFSPKQKPIIAQLFGSNPKSFAEVIPQIVDLGFDGIDLNMGCPSKNILEQGGGGALINQYGLVEKIITSSLNSLNSYTPRRPAQLAEVGLNSPIPLSVKTRIGATEKETRDWLTFLAGFPISALCVHARPLKQMHSGQSQLDQLSKFSKLFQSKKIIFLGNGGIQNREEGIEVSQKYHLDGVLIGQAALGHPWIFIDRHSERSEESQSCHSRESGNLYNKYPSQKQIFHTMLRHAQLAYDFYGAKNFIAIRKHLAWYCRHFPGAKDLRIKLLQTNNLEDVKSALSLFNS